MVELHDPTVSVSALASAKSIRKVTASLTTSDSVIRDIRLNSSFGFHQFYYRTYAPDT